MGNEAIGPRAQAERFLTLERDDDPPGASVPKRERLMAVHTGRNLANGKRNVVPKAPADEGPGLFSILISLRKHWPIVVACTMMATGAALLYSKTLPFLYEANALRPDAALCRVHYVLAHRP